MVRGSFNKGKLNGNIGWLKFNNGSGFIGFDAIYVNGLIDNYESKDTTDHFTPNQLYYYSGKFRNGMKNGYGELICRKPNYIVFEGEWCDNLPVSNRDLNGQDSSLITFYNVNVDPIGEVDRIIYF